MKKALLWIIGIVVVLIVVVQLLPMGRNHTNPTVTQEAPWASPEARALAVRACYDCHSNETVWPWYSNVAPVSWLVQNDVDEGRAKLNFSEWDKPQRKIEDAAEVIQKGAMPLPKYLPLHSTANLSQAEKEQLLVALKALGAE